MKQIEPGSIDWNVLEEMIERLGPIAVKDAVQRIEEGLAPEDLKNVPRLDD